MKETSRGAFFEISFPHHRNTFTKLRQLYSLPSSRRHAVRELNDTYELLNERYKELEESKAEIQKHLAERIRISRDLHDDVGATLGSISIYSEVAKNKSAGNADMDDMLTKIGDSSREMLEKMNDIVWAVNPKNDNAEQLIQRMKNFAAIMLSPRNITFHYADGTEKLNELTLGMGQRKNIFLIYKEGLHNIVKYANAMNVEMKIIVKGNLVHFLLKDDGKGFQFTDASVYNGNGIKNMKARAEEIGALFELKSEVNIGTEINVSVPV
jgi:signal transduction histidine kinase